MSGQDDEPREIPQAVEERSHWAGWIWAVPIAALAIVGYLGVKQFSERGPEVTVVFQAAGGVTPSNTKVKYEGMEVGEVDAVTLQKDLRQVKVSLRLHPDMAGHLGPGTRFWIGGESPSLTDLSSLKSVIAGPFIGVDPHDGRQQRQYVGLAAPPAVKETAAGTRYVLHAGELGSVSRGSKIFYRDLQVGTVEMAKLEPAGKQFAITAFVRAPFDKLVHDGTRFWNASAVQFAMSGPGPRVQLQSVSALFSGAIDFETPADASAGPPAKQDAEFRLFDSKTDAENAPDKRYVSYRVTFSAKEAGDLDADAPVMLAEKRVGSVQGSTLEYEPRSGELESLVTIAIDPSRIALGDGESWHADARPQMNALLEHLIAQGLRASIAKTVPLVGSDAVTLDFVPKATEASLGTGTVPEIPSAPGSDISGMIASLGGVGAKLNAMPLDQIADEVHQTTQKLAALSSSPQLKESLERLDSTVANVDDVTRETREQLGPILDKLRNVATEAQSTVADAKSLLAGSGNEEIQPDTTGVGNALYELARAARSLRELADFLDRHPEALLRGRG